MRRTARTLLTGLMIVVGVSAVLFYTSGETRAQLEENSPWPMFHRNLQHTGQSPYDTSHVDGTVKWKFNLGGTLYASPAIAADGTVYVCIGDSLIAFGGPKSVLPLVVTGIGMFMVAAVGGFVTWRSRKR